MNLRTVYDGIAAVESEFDVDALRIDGINVWVPIRTAMLIQPFLNHRELSYRESLDDRAITDPLAADSRRPVVRSGEVDVEFRRLGGLSYFRTTDLDWPSEPDLLFFHGFPDYTDVEDGGCYNKIADSLLELYPSPDRCAKVIRARPDSLQARFTIPGWQFLEESNGQHPRPALPGEATLLRQLDEIVTFCNRTGIPTIYHPERVLGQLRTLVWRAEQFGRLLQQVRPRAVVLSSFVNPLRMAMIVAARRNGVTSVDVEHGFMGYLSAYGTLGCVPDTGWDCLPDYFWVWGEESARLLHRSLGQAAQVHRPVIGGSPAHQRNRHTPTTHGTVSETLQRRKGTTRRTALFCWQPDMLVHEDETRLLPSALEDAMRRDPTTLWLIRLHPRSRHLIPKVERHLATIGHTNFDVATATTDPLLPLITFSDVVLTSYSTVAFEANEQHRPVVLIDNVGIGMMEDYVERGIFAAGTDGPTLLTAIEHATNTPVETVDYIHKDPTSHLTAFKQILARRT